jgi:hypothetical protein
MLVQLLQSPCRDTKSTAADVINALAKLPACQVELAEAGAMQVLTKLLHTAHQQCTCLSCKKP